LKNKSVKTIALWVFLIVVFFAIYQTVSRTAGGQPLTLSEFIAKALPPVDSKTKVRSGRIAEVHVYGKRIFYRVRTRGSGDTRATQDKNQGLGLAGEGVWFETRGDVTMPTGPDGESLLASMALRGIRVTVHDEGDKPQIQGEERPFSSFLAQVERVEPPTNVAKVVIRGNEIRGELKDPSGQRFVAVGHLGDYYRRELIRRGVEVTEEPEGENSLWLSILGTWLPMIFIFLIFFLFMRQLQAGGGKAMSFGKSRHRLLNESNHKVTFKDIAGIDEAKEELQEIIQFLKDPKKFTRLGGRIPKGVLLMGPPGTGKTLLAKGVAGEAGVPFFSISGSDFVEMFVGVGASRVRDLFEQGKKNAPCIIFIDEIDAVGRQRGAGLGGGHDEREQTLNQLLVEMDGFESNEGVILVAATNRPDVLDPALLRPGRFDRRVVVNRPDVKGREAILKVHTRKTRVSKDVKLSVIARGTPGFSGADLENLVNEAALLAARRSKDLVEMDDFESAKDKVMMGAERRSVVMSEEEKRVTAYHEAGHALVALRVPGNDPLHKVTIIPRGMALGVTWTLPESDQHNMSQEQVLGHITMAMGGRVAEELTFDQITTGAGNDIEQATKMARKMVTEWGMSRLGPIALGENRGSVFLGRDMARASDFSEQTHAEVDVEVRRIVTECYELATRTLEEHRDQLEIIATALLEFESLDGAEVAALLEAKSLDVVRERRAAAAAARDGAEGDVAPPKDGTQDGRDSEGGAAGGMVPDVPEPASTRGRVDPSA